MQSKNNDLQVLGYHRSGQRRNLPSEAKLLEHVAVVGEHWVMRPYKHLRWFDARNGQALIKLDGAVWNLARALLQARGVTGSGFHNACGHVDCVNPMHWVPQHAATRAFSVLHLGGTWRLCGGTGALQKDAVFVAGVQGEPVHVVRALYAIEETRFITACGIAPAPGLLVMQDRPTCEACLR